MKFAAAITLYNPTFNQIRLCKEYEASFDKIFILDNSEMMDYSLKEVFEKNKFCYIKMDGNEGLPKAFNVVLPLVINEGFDYICTLDQDSIFSHSNIEIMKEFIKKNTNPQFNFNKVAIFAPTIDYGKGLKQTEGFEYRKRVITSGAFLNVEILKKHKIKYDEKYFIDKFEIDLCQQIINLNYKIVVFFESVLVQHLGDGDVNKHSSHNALRHYYLFRNRFYFNNKYGINVLQTLRHCFDIIAFEHNKFSKLMQLFPATLDYITGRMGKR